MVERVRILLAVATLIVAACGGQPTPGPTASPAPTPTATATATPSPSPPPAVGGSLGEALALTGPIPQSIYFTDWASVRVSVGAEDLTGASRFQEKARAIRNESTLAGFGVAELATHAADWGFDVFDLEWEASATAPGSFFWVLRLRDGFDVALLTAKLDAYGFASERLPRGVLRTGTAADFFQPDRTLRNLSFMNTGIVDDGRTLVLSGGGADTVRAALTDGPQPVADLSVQSVARLLGDPLAAAIIAGFDCRQVVQSYGGASPEVQAMVDEQVAAAGPLQVYNALAVGYSRADQPVGRIVIGYPEEGPAAADLAGRRALAQDGISSLSRDVSALVRYRDRFFVLADARVEERSIVLDLTQVALETPSPDPDSIRPDEFLPRYLMQFFARRDMLFATC